MFVQVGGVCSGLMCWRGGGGGGSNIMWWVFFGGRVVDVQDHVMRGGWGGVFRIMCWGWGEVLWGSGLICKMFGIFVQD